MSGITSGGIFLISFRSPKPSSTESAAEHLNARARLRASRLYLRLAHRGVSLLCASQPRRHEAPTESFRLGTYRAREVRVVRESEFGSKAADRRLTFGEPLNGMTHTDSVAVA